MGVDVSRIDLITGVAIAIPGFFIGVAAPFWGRMADVFGHKLMIMRAFLLSTALFFLFSVVNSVFLFVTLRVLQGLLTGIITSSIALVSASTPRKYQNKALRTLALSNLLASTLIPSVSGAIVLAIGLSTSLRMGSVIILFSGIIAYLFIKEPLKKDRRTSVLVKGYSKYKSKIVDCVLPQYRQVLFGAIAVSGMVNLMRVSSISMALLVVLKYTPEHNVKMLSSITIGVMGIWGLLSTYGIPYITLKSKKSSFTISAFCIALFAFISLIALLLYPLLGYISYIVLCAIALGVSDGIDVVMQEVIGRLSYDEHKGSVFGKLTRVSGFSRFLGTLLISGISGYFGMNVASIAMIMILILTLVVLCYVRIEEKKTAYSMKQV